ncbi:MAG: hypothetical protein HGA84_02280 [Syntrophobacteraceae bacterium]|nr:hypothetical protein [Syntrophobacteraceae bacterium]
MSRKLMGLMLVLLFVPSYGAAQDKVVKISALANGALLLNGQPTDLSTLEAELGKASAAGGEVWYYREDPANEPPPSAMAAVQLVIKYRLPVSFSIKPDFSDAVDPGTGVSRPRQTK